jgi:hypothetical protein
MQSCVHSLSFTQSTKFKFWSEIDLKFRIGFCLSFEVLRGKVVGSIPDGVTGIFRWLNTSDRSIVLGSTKPLTEMSTRDISCRVKAAGA